MALPDLQLSCRTLIQASTAGCNSGIGYETMRVSEKLVG
jgi:hypothetical protein